MSENSTTSSEKADSNCLTNVQIVEKLDQLQVELHETKSVLVALKETVEKQNQGLHTFGVALQDCIDAVQPAGYPLREGVTPKTLPDSQIVTPPVTPPAPQSTAAQMPPQTPQQTTLAPKPPVAQPAKPMNRIDQLNPGDKKIFLTAKILDLKKPRTTSTGKRVTEAIIADETGTITLSLWESQIDQVKIDDMIIIENGYTTVYDGKTILNIGQFGKLTVET